MLRKSPGLTAIILIMLTLGIGATTAVFTVFDAILLRPLAYEKPEQLVQIWQKRTEGPFQQFEFSYPDYLDVKRENKVFSQIGRLFEEQRDSFRQGRRGTTSGGRGDYWLL